MTSASDTKLYEVLQRQITQLGESMQMGQQRIEDALLRLETRVGGLETRESGWQAGQSARLDAAWRFIDEQKLINTNVKCSIEAVETNANKALKDAEDKSVKLSDRIVKLEERLGLFTWIVSVGGGAAITYIVTHLLGLIK